MKGTVFFKQAELLLRILPLIYKEDVFALKGGTAINFFVQDLPRLSGMIPKLGWTSSIFSLLLSETPKAIAS
jgi:hypothetical protein